MAGIVVTSNDTLVLNGNVFVDLADGDVTVLEYPNDIADSKTGKNGNSIISQNMSGFNATLTLRLLRGSADDQFMQNLLTTANAPNGFVAQTLLSGSFTKMLGDGTGTITSDIYTLVGGFFKKQVAGKENVEGQTDQGVSIYPLQFTNCTRTIS